MIQHISEKHCLVIKHLINSLLSNFIRYIYILIHRLCKHQIISLLNQKRFWFFLQMVGILKLIFYIIWLSLNTFSISILVIHASKSNVSKIYIENISYTYRNVKWIKEKSWSCNMKAERQWNINTYIRQNESRNIVQYM